MSKTKKTDGGNGAPQQLFAGAERLTGVIAITELGGATEGEMLELLVCSMRAGGAGARVAVAWCEEVAGATAWVMLVEINVHDPETVRTGIAIFEAGRGSVPPEWSAKCQWFPDPILKCAWSLAAASSRKPVKLKVWLMESGQETPRLVLDKQFEESSDES